MVCWKHNLGFHRRNLTGTLTRINSRPPNQGGLRPAFREAAYGGLALLLHSGEPFRLLFPLGTLIGLFGVLLWPAFVWDLLTVYPGVLHARIMIEGFFTCFVFGFLGTALPRMLGAPRLTARETIGFATALVVITGLHFTGRTGAGDGLFLFTLLAFLGVLALRLPHRQDVPPPSFVLVIIGLLAAVAGTLILLIAGHSALPLPGWLQRLSGLLRYQGYLLFPVMGVGAFLLPRFFGLPNRQAFPEAMTLPPGWGRRAAFAGACGLVVMTGFVLEACGMVRAGALLRAFGLLVYFWREAPLHQAREASGSLGFGLRLALVSIPLGYVLMAVSPGHVTSFLHVVMISGFSLLIFTVASRVILGHSGQDHRFVAAIPAVVVMTWLIVLAMATRVSADWLPATRFLHYGYAGLSWALGVTIWAVAMLPAVLRPDTDNTV